jgi:hypothetical protein
MHSPSRKFGMSVVTAFAPKGLQHTSPGHRPGKSIPKDSQPCKGATILLPQNVPPFQGLLLV